MAKVFISYRREDSQWPADRLYDTLKPLMADPERDIFIDVDNIPLGVDFKDHLDERVAQCETLLALIGRDWLDVRHTDTGSRRLDDPGDFVRIEIASALKRGIRVVPVLLDGAPMPAADELPDDLKALSLRNGVEIRRLSFEADAARLVRGLGLVRGGPSIAQNAPAAIRPASHPAVESPSTGEGAQAAISDGQFPLTIRRQRALSGWLFRLKIFCDGKRIAEVANGQTVHLAAPRQSAQFRFAFWSTAKSDPLWVAAGSSSADVRIKASDWGGLLCWVDGSPKAQKLKMPISALGWFVIILSIMIWVLIMVPLAVGG